jgi:hypothetical protein
MDSEGDKRLFFLNSVGFANEDVYLLCALSMLLVIEDNYSIARVMFA